MLRPYEYSNPTNLEELEIKAGVVNLKTVEGLRCEHTKTVKYVYEGAGITEIFYSVENRPDLELIIHRVCGHEIGDVKTGAVRSESHFIHPTGTLEVLYITGDGVLEIKDATGHTKHKFFPKTVESQDTDIEVHQGEEVVWKVGKGKELVYLSLQKKYEVS